MVVSSSICYFKLFQNNFGQDVCGKEADCRATVKESLGVDYTALCLCFGGGCKTAEIIDLVPTNNEFHWKFKRDSCLS